MAQHLDTADETMYQSTQARANQWHRAACADLERLVKQAVDGQSMTDGAELAIASTQRGSRYTVVAVAGEMDGRALLQLRWYLSGLIDAGSCHLVVDVSCVRGVNDRMMGLMHWAEDRVAARGGVFELTGLTPPFVRRMDDGTLAGVLTLYRAMMDRTGPDALHFPQGISEVPEPHSAGRSRVIVDFGHHHV